MGPGKEDTLLRLLLRQGSVFYVQDRHFSSSEPHYFVVLNRAPLANRCLLLVASSSQVEKVKKRNADLPPETLLEVSPSEYPEFNKPSIIDCNTIIEKDHATLAQQLRRDHSINRPDVPSAILDRIITGVLKSPVVTVEHKELIRRVVKPGLGQK